jgi:hypothetical protein
MNFLKGLLGGAGALLGGAGSLVGGFFAGPKLLAAFGIGALLLASGAYLKGRYDGNTICEAYYAAEKVRILKERDSAREQAAEADAKAADADAKHIEDLKAKANDTPKNPTVCLDRAAAKRIRSVRP